MTVRPTQPGQTSSSGLTRTGKVPAPGTAASRTPQAGEPAAPASEGDQLRISSEARNLQQLGSGAQGSTNELSADRMREVVRRMNDGHYDKPEVMDQVIRRMVKDL